MRLADHGAFNVGSRPGIVSSPGIASVPSTLERVVIKEGLTKLPGIPSRAKSSCMRTMSSGGSESDALKKSVFDSVSPALR